MTAGLWVGMETGFADTTDWPCEMSLDAAIVASWFFLQTIATCSRVLAETQNTSGIVRFKNTHCMKSCIYPNKYTYGTVY